MVYCRALQENEMAILKCIYNEEKLAICRSADCHAVQRAVGEGSDQIPNTSYSIGV